VAEEAVEAAARSGYGIAAMKRKESKSRLPMVVHQGDPNRLKQTRHCSILGGC